VTNTPKAEAAAEAYRQLARLGVRVAYGRPKAGKDGLAMKPSETAPLLRKAVGTVRKLFWSMGTTLTEAGSERVIDAIRNRAFVVDYSVNL